MFCRKRRRTGDRGILLSTHICYLSFSIIVWHISSRSLSPSYGCYLKLKTQNVSNILNNMFILLRAEAREAEYIFLTLRTPPSSRPVPFYPKAPRNACWTKLRGNLNSSPNHQESPPRFLVWHCTSRFVAFTDASSSSGCKQYCINRRGTGAPKRYTHDTLSYPR